MSLCPGNPLSPRGADAQTTCSDWQSGTECRPARQSGTQTQFPGRYSVQSLDQGDVGGAFARHAGGVVWRWQIGGDLLGAWISGGGYPA